MGLRVACDECSQPGATLQCLSQGCPRAFHLMCARNSGCYMGLVQSGPEFAAIHFFCTQHSAARNAPPAPPPAPQPPQRHSAPVALPPAWGEGAVPKEEAAPAGTAPAPPAPMQGLGHGQDAGARGAADALGVLGEVAYGVSGGGSVGDKTPGGANKASRSSRCGVCVKQRKGRCGTESGESASELRAARGGGE